MNIGFVGLGKLGLPVALSIENKGHNVAGYDVNPDVYDYVRNRTIPYQEAGTPELLLKTKIKMMESVDNVVAFSDIVFVPVQTPHHPMYEGITRIPDNRVDFEYKYLVSAMKTVSEACDRLNKQLIVVIISTVLPGTIEREVKPILSHNVKLSYNPFFIAMGTTRKDFESPEFVLLGCDDNEATKTVKKFYATIHDKPVFETTVRNAELIKVIYNTYISSKIAFINTVMEICHKMGADVDAVSDALSLANERIISPKYLRGGMGDGGGCHPRDNIALSWLAKKIKLSYDYFEHIMIAREKQTEWLAKLVKEEYLKDKRPIVILGKAFKKETNLTVGSPSVLLKNLLEEYDLEVVMYDPLIDKAQHKSIMGPYIYFIGTNHDVFSSYEFPEGATVIDPWGTIKDQAGVKVMRIGRS